jgi:hypothetical protein
MYFCVTAKILNIIFSYWLLAIGYWLLADAERLTQNNERERTNGGANTNRPNKSEQKRTKANKGEQSEQKRTPLFGCSFVRFFVSYASGYQKSKCLGGCWLVPVATDSTIYLC